jgi:apoptosis-stimulating of p53 protein 1
LVHVEFIEALYVCVCVSAASDLDSIRALFNEKEKELSLAVAKVEELTRQLEELKRGRGTSARDQQQQTPSPAALELDKLRRELMVCLTV